LARSKGKEGPKSALPNFGREREEKGEERCRVNQRWGVYEKKKRPTGNSQNTDCTRRLKKKKKKWESATFIREERVARRCSQPSPPRKGAKDGSESKGEYWKFGEKKERRSDRKSLLSCIHAMGEKERGTNSLFTVRKRRKDCGQGLTSSITA